MFILYIRKIPVVVAAAYPTIHTKVDTFLSPGVKFSTIECGGGVARWEGIGAKSFRRATLVSA